MFTTVEECFIQEIWFKATQWPCHFHVLNQRLSIEVTAAVETRVEENTLKVSTRNVQLWFPPRPSCAPPLIFSVLFFCWIVLPLDNVFVRMVSLAAKQYCELQNRPVSCEDGSPWPVSLFHSSGEGDGWNFRVSAVLSLHGRLCCSPPLLWQHSSSPIPWTALLSSLQIVLSNRPTDCSGHRLYGIPDVLYFLMFVL